MISNDTIGTSANPPIGTVSESLIVTIPINQFLYLIPFSENRKIKKIYISAYSNNINEVLKYYYVRFRLRNRDISIFNQYAGNILNGLSGSWDGSIPKDSIVDLGLSSKKNFIEFKDGILAGGIQFQSFRYEMQNPTTSLLTIRMLIGIQYE